jgi:pimeloyl-ACP methyl ester carboxylesterase
MARRSILSIALCLLMAGAALSQVKPKESFFKTKDGVKIAYYTIGKGTPVILIHGYTGSALGNWFRNGVAEALAKTNLVIAIDCRNHGKSDKPQINGPGRAEDVIELMDHLKIQRAHLHGYSMGGSITATLLALIPDRIITASFGGSGIRETEPEWIAKVPKDKEGRDPQEAEASRNLRIHHAMDNGMSREEAEKAADAPQQQRTRPAPTEAARAEAAARPKLDLTKLNIPMLAIIGEYDNPLARTHRMWREARNFKLVILPGKSHLTAIAAPYIPKEYQENLVKFINSHDPKK